MLLFGRTQTNVWNIAVLSDSCVWRQRHNDVCKVFLWSSVTQKVKSAFQNPTLQIKQMTGFCSKIDLKSRGKFEQYASVQRLRSAIENQNKHIVGCNFWNGFASFPLKDSNLALYFSTVVNRVRSFCYYMSKVCETDTDEHDRLYYVRMFPYFKSLFEWVIQMKK